MFPPASLFTQLTFFLFYTLPSNERYDHLIAHGAVSLTVRVVV